MSTLRELKDALLGILIILAMCSGPIIGIWIAVNDHSEPAPYPSQSEGGYSEEPRTCNGRVANDC